MNWNWQAMFFTVAVILAIATVIAGIVSAPTDEYKPPKSRYYWFVSLFILTLITAALAAGLS
jgi:hypothetical protein